MKIRIGMTIIPILAALVTSGCGGAIERFHRQMPPTYTRQPELPLMEKIGVVTVGFSPQTDFKALLNNHQSAVVTGGAVGAAGGAAVGGAVGMVAVLSSLGACLNPFAAATCPSVGAFVAGGAAVGGVAGAAAGQAAEDKTKEMGATANVKDVAGSIGEALQSLQMSKSVQERIVKYGAAMTTRSFVSIPLSGLTEPNELRDYSKLRSSGVDTILEVSVMRASVGSDGDLFKPISGRLAVTARARLIRVADNQLMNEADYRFVSQPMFHVQLAANDAAAFKQLFNLAYQDLAEQIVDRLFLIYEPSLDRKRSASQRGRCIESPLRPEYPKFPKNALKCPRCDGGDLVWEWALLSSPFATVDSLQPEFRWESFPTPEERKADRDGELSTLDDVHYEVKIYEAASEFDAGMMPGPLVDSRTTQTASYRPETPLKSCNHYFLTFRARFNLNGQPRATEWAGVRNEGLIECYYIRSPPPTLSRKFYPFKTACSKSAH